MKTITNPFVLTLVMLITLGWFSGLWWQGQQKQMLATRTHQAQASPQVPPLGSLPAVPGDPGAAKNSAAVQESQ